MRPSIRATRGLPRASRLSLTPPEPRASRSRPSAQRRPSRAGRVQRWILRPRSAGQALVELAIILPIMLLLLLAALDLGRMYYARITVVNAARSAAFYASESTTAGSADLAGAVDAAINESRGSFVSVAASDVTVSCTPGCGKAYGNRVNAVVVGQFRLLTPILAVFFGGQDVSFSSTATADIVYIPPAPVVASASASVNPSASVAPSTSAGPSTSVDPSASAAPSASASASPSTSPCPLPFVNFSYTQQNKNKPVVFTSSATPTSGACAIYNWRWEYNDGTGAVDAGNFPSVSHTFPQKGVTYQVTLTVTVPGSITNSVTLSVTTQS